MAIYRNGINGRPSGKMGNIVYYMLNGQSVARSIGRPGKISERQRANHQAMSVTMSYLKHMVDFINAGYGSKASGTIKNPFNLATSYNKKHALKGVYPNLSVDYSKVVLSQGILQAPKATTMVKSGKGIAVSWDPFSDAYCRHDDMVMVMLYHPAEANKGTTTSLYAARRSEGKCFILCPYYDTDQPIEGYIFFKSSDNKAVSDSVYLGNLNGTAETIQQKQQKTQYEKVKERFATVEKTYFQLIDQVDGPPTNNKTFNSVLKEYEILQKQLIEQQERLGTVKTE